MDAVCVRNDRPETLGVWMKNGLEYGERWLWKWNILFHMRQKFYGPM